MTAHDRRLLPLALNAVGMVVVAYGFFSGPFAARHGVWLVVACVVAIIAWAAVEILPSGLAAPDGRGHAALRRVRRVAVFAGVVVASLSQAPTKALTTAPLAVILVMAISDEDESVWLGAAAAALAVVLTPVGSLIAHGSVESALSFEVGNAVWVLIGVARRQARTAGRRNRELLAQQQTAREQETRAALLADRQAAARDIHDVLAHSLGGLVVQLDAAEALLEARRPDDAQAKVAQARALAAEGLADARRAVAALRSPDETGHVERDATDLEGAAERLLRAHRELGGTVDAHLDLARAAIPAPVATAFARALQEALSNARRHAPGEPVAAALTAADGVVRLTVSNPAASDASHGTVGGGHGLTGMAERFAALPGGAATAVERDGRFVVSASARLAAG